MILLLLAACGNPWNLPRDAEIPRPGDLTEAIGTLDEEVDGIQIFVHPHDPGRALIGGYLGNAWILWHADADRREVRRVCEDYDDDRVLPTRVAWRNDAAFWDEVDGQVVLQSAGSWPDWDLYRCGADRLPERVAFFELPVWPGSSALTPDGIVTWPLGEDHPVHVALDDPFPSPLPSIGLPVKVVKRHDARGLWAALHDQASNILTVVDLDGSTLETRTALSVDLGDETFLEVQHLHPDALVFHTDAGMRGASAAAGGTVHDLSQLGLYGTPLLYPDGTGFSVHLTPWSVDLTTGSVVNAGMAVRSGHHYVLTRTPAGWEVEVSENRNGHTGPVASYFVEVPLEQGFTDHMFSAVVGFGDGSCALAWTSEIVGGLLGGHPFPFDPGDEGWWVNLDVLAWTRCGSDEAEILMRGLALADLGDVVGTAKLDHMTFSLHRARTVDHPDRDADRLRMGWAVGSSGQATGLFTDVHTLDDASTLQRHGTAVWVVKGLEVRHGDFGPRL